MAERKPPEKASKDGRDARLKAALKANLARRKAQSKARTEDAGKTGKEGA
ncbi:MAG: hypothetical protein AAGM84_00695 [Pseudomonadota bacterium]